MTTQNNSDALLTYLVSQVATGAKNWFGFQQQKVAGIHLAYEIAKLHADKMSPDDIADFAFRLNNAIYKKLIREDL